MTDSFSGPGAGTCISATVERYDAARGYGVLDPGDGAPAVFCPRPALEAVGMEILLAGATVACETVPGRHGPEVSRIHAVDFSTASARPSLLARAPGNGRPAAEPDAAPAGPAVSGPAASARPLCAVVKWFLPMKGYGFLEPEDGSPDIFCHVSAVEASGRNTLPQGAVVTCETVQGDRGSQVSKIISVEAPAVEARPPARARPFDGRYPGPDAAGQPAADLDVAGTVKFYDPIRGFGFVVPDDGGREVFVHASVLLRSGLADLQQGQRVFVRAESVPRGLQATEIEPA
ncbi:MAG: cold shock domain-containing protein [Rhodospirillaceae bacterium]|nr:cold shock domain-containing protein [Rhodospirillaceae bacterium]MDE0616723.1 cold shock domain-containing protein [Rhodospirillaceae bacterium]